MIDRSPELMTIDEVSKFLCVHRSTVYRLVRNGELPAFKVGDQWRFNKSQVDQWLSGIQQTGRKKARAVKI
jgi:excisionase family DNA binding protein